MAKQIITYCDPCLREETQVLATTVTIAIDGNRPLMLDLCETHEKELVAPLYELLMDAGAPVRADELTCQSCGKAYKKRESLRKHVERHHGAGAAAPSSPQGQLDISSTGDEPKPYDCPDCDSSFSTPQGRGAHRSRAHGYVSEHPKTTSAKRARAAESS